MVVSAQLGGEHLPQWPWELPIDAFTDTVHVVLYIRRQGTAAACPASAAGALPV
ncbi:hypothetical protein [Streptomyces sp. NBC_01006]|uniref:hypothetical protein n=1 Tax=Streptomyces sp. NBC_01006 TaxID=2903716 RepID=UPI00386EAE8F|nr:hypothetical protein OG509_42180 [Streptomyces sp. NBC_01006]